MAKIIAVLDSCVLFPNILRDTLLSAFDIGLYQGYWSQIILDGVTRNLIKRQILTEKKAKNLEDIIKSYFPEAMIDVSPELIKKMTNHEGDYHVLATAVEAKAEIIVTFNLKHFQPKDTIQWGVSAQHPDSFLLSLLQSDSGLMLEAINEQISRFTNPPLNHLQLLEMLAKDTPKFVNELKNYLSIDNL